MIFIYSAPSKHSFKTYETILEVIQIPNQKIAKLRIMKFCFGIKSSQNPSSSNKGLLFWLNITCITVSPHRIATPKTDYIKTTTKMNLYKSITNCMVQTPPRAVSNPFEGQLLGRGTPSCVTQLNLLIKTSLQSLIRGFFPKKK